MVVEMPDLSGKYGVVTGATSGVGEALVRELTARGARVLFSYNSSVDEAAQIGDQTGSSYAALNLGDPKSIESFLEVVKAGGPVNYFIANAGVESTGSLVKQDYDEICRVVGTNQIGNMFLVRGLVVGELMQRGGQIAGIGSIASQGNHDQFAYSSSKGGLASAILAARRDAQVRAQELGLKVFEPPFIRGTKMADRYLKIIERKGIPNKARQVGAEADALINEFRESGYALDLLPLTVEILRLTVDPSVTGVVRIPEGADLNVMRARFLDDYILE